MELPVLVVGSRRLLAQIAVVFLLVSCSARPAGTTVPDSSGAASVGSETAGTGSFTSDSTSTPLTSAAAQVSTLNPGDTKLPELTLAASGDNTTLTIVAPTGASSAVALAGAATTSSLSNPNRLVVDFPQSISSKATSQTFDNPSCGTVSSGCAKKIRVASYNGKTRVVFDLAEGTKVTPSVSSSEGNITIALSSDSAAANLAAVSSTSIISTGSAGSSLTPSDTTLVAPEFAANAPDLNSASDFNSSSGSDSSAARLAAIRFERAGAARNQLVLDMDSAGVYSLKRTAPSEFVLRLEDATLSEAANQVLVAPSTDGKIRSVRPTVDGNDVVLRIFSAPETSLRAESKNGGIVVSTASLGDEVFADARAQLAPEKDEPAKAEGAKTEGAEVAKDTSVAANAGADAGATGELSALLEDQQYTGRLISLDLQDTDIDNALRIIAEVSNLNIVTTQDVQGKITLRLIDVPWDQALDVILKINSLGKVQEGNVVRIAPLDKIRAEREALKQAKQAEEQLEELKVRYMRISYARAADLKPLTETVLSERGTVAYDERSNQLIIKDTKAGVSRVVELVKKIDLRTPQVLLETQIVESTRGFQRQLGSRFGFKFVQSPATGNGTGWNFPNAIIGDGSSNNLGGLSNSSPGYLNLLFGSADGTKNLDVTLAAAENEGLARVISRPSVATTNNKQATIKSVTKLRVKAPSGGTQVAVGQGGQTSGSPVATETIEAGITLDVTPQASPDYYVLLDINAKSSSFAEGLGVDGIPSEIERSATSTILVSSGQTFVMGGIYKITENNKLNGVPFMKDIPVLGHMFRFSDTNNTDEELLFFITPRIVEGSFDDAAMKASL
jgi:type IV pilus assembly protein PilQ